MSTVRPAGRRGRRVPARIGPLAATAREARLHHRGRRVHRQHAGRSAQRAGRGGRRSSTTSARAGGSSSPICCAALGPARRGRRARPAGAGAGRWRAVTGSFTFRPMRTCVMASSTRDGTSSRTRSPPRACSRRCARAACRGSRSPRPARSTASPMSSPRPRTRRFPVQTSLYAASKLAGEALISAYAAGYGFSGRHLPLRVDPGRALHARARVRLLSARSSAIRHACGCWATAARRSPTCTCRTASSAILTAAARHHDEPGAYVYNLGTDETVLVDESVRDHQRAPRTLAAGASTPAAGAAGPATAR